MQDLIDELMQKLGGVDSSSIASSAGQLPMSRGWSGTVHTGSAIRCPSSAVIRGEVELVTRERSQDVDNTC